MKLRQQNLNNLKQLKSEYNTVKDAKLFQLKSENLEKIQDIELRKKKISTN